MSVQQPGSGGLLFKLGLVVLSIGLCALSMLVMRQARLQAAHEVTQTQLRIQRADEQLWKMRADIAGLSNPARIRELAQTMGPMHALINPVDVTAGPAINASIPMVEKFAPFKLPGKPEAKTAKATSTKPADAKSASAKPSDKPAAEKPAAPATTKPQSKPDPKSTPRPTVSPTGLAAIPPPKVRDLER